MIIYVNINKDDLWKNSIFYGQQITKNDTQIQTEILEMINAGVTIEACKDCADNFGVTEKLERLGISVRYMGLPLTEYLKNGEKLISI